MKPHLHLSLIVSILVVFTGAALLARPEPARSDAAPIAASYAFPQRPEVLNRYIVDGDTVSMRHHAWTLWAGLTANAPCCDDPVWRTWWPDCATRGGESSNCFFAPVRQLIDDASAGGAGGGAAESADAVAPRFQTEPPFLVVSVLFNDAAHNWIQTHCLHRTSGLKAIDATFTATTPVSMRNIPEFPPESIVLKAVWTVVRAEGSTLPVWSDTDRNIASRAEAARRPSDWSASVAVLTLPGAVPPQGVDDTASIDEFYFVRLDADLAANFNKAAGLKLDEVEKFGARDGDYAVLLGMHVATKELPDWTWCTFWWHNNPDGGEFAQGRPSAVKGKWRNYLMDVAFDPELPAEPTGKPNACFNPWLEAQFGGDGGGANSNCVSCHARARWQDGRRAGSTLLKRGRVDKSNAILFGQSVRLDYIWSLYEPKLP